MTEQWYEVELEAIYRETDWKLANSAFEATAEAVKEFAAKHTECSTVVARDVRKFRTDARPD